MYLSHDFVNVFHVHTWNTVWPETFVGILIWQIGKFFTKSSNLIPPNMQARARERDVHNCAHDSVQQGHVQRTRIRQIKIL